MYIFERKASGAANVCNAQATLASGTTRRTLVTFSVLTSDERATLMT
jgi:hypothetical protein